MSDQDNRKDALERLFQRKAEEYDISYNEDNWQELEGRLDNLDRQRTRRTRRWLVAAAIALTFSVLAYFTIENQLQINKLSKQVSSTQHSEQTQNSLKQDSDAESAIESNPSESKNLSTRQNEPSERKNKTVASARQKKGSFNAEEMQKTTKSDQSFENNPITEKAIAVIRIAPDFEEHLPSISAIKPIKTKIGSNDLNAGSHNEPLALVNNRDKFTRRQFTHASLGLVMGPDLSTVGSIAHFYDPGYKLGVTLDYNLGPNWGITTGIIRTRTRYTAGKGDYRLPHGYLPGSVSPQKTMADCMLLDIPVTLKYRFLHFNHSRLYATAGVSSYIMLNEKYRFMYDNNHAGLAQGWSGKTGTRHWLSNASFSVGYELDILKNWSLRAEPFIKIPLKEVGWGNVKLYSMGSIISLNYKLK